MSPISGGTAGTVRSVPDVFSLSAAVRYVQGLDLQVQVHRTLAWAVADMAFREARVVGATWLESEAESLVRSLERMGEVNHDELI